MSRLSVPPSKMHLLSHLRSLVISWSRRGFHHIWGQTSLEVPPSCSFQRQWGINSRSFVSEELSLLVKGARAMLRKQDFLAYLACLDSQVPSFLKPFLVKIEFAYRLDSFMTHSKFYEHLASWSIFRIKGWPGLFCLERIGSLPLPGHFILTTAKRLPWDWERTSAAMMYISQESASST